jgi:hypothetical protein
MDFPPKDSWIRLAPGAGVALNVDVQNQWRDKTVGLRQVRGTILAAVFEIEYSLDRLLREILFPGYDKQPSTDSTPASSTKLGVDIRERCTLFDELFLKSRSANLDRKINILSEIARGVKSFSAVLPEGLIRALRETNQVRNKFAHYPISFDPVDASGQQELQAKLICKNEEIVLDNAYLSQLFARVQEAITGLDQLNQYLTS